eukprot:234605_1
MPSLQLLTHCSFIIGIICYSAMHKTTFNPSKFDHNEKLILICALNLALEHERRDIMNSTISHNIDMSTMDMETLYGGSFSCFDIFLVFRDISNSNRLKYQEIVQFIQTIIKQYGDYVIASIGRDEFVFMSVQCQEEIIKIMDQNKATSMYLINKS